jgi:hypothetical protein
MSISRAVPLLGMHRSGTSAIARGLTALGVYLGHDFLDAQPENPTGYWEDKGIVAIDDRVLGALGLHWDSISLIEPRELQRRRVRALAREAIEHCRRTFQAAPLWGFKDPRAIRVLPFWRRVLRECGAEDSYVVAIRNPRSVAASLFRRQAMDADEAYRLWLVHMVPFLRDLADAPLAIVDYDLFMRDPRGQLERMGRKLALTFEPNAPAVDAFVTGFLDAKLRHSTFSPEDLDAGSEAARLTRDAYLQLLELAADQREADPAFWSAWETTEASLRALIPARPARRWLF